VVLLEPGNVIVCHTNGGMFYMPVFLNRITWNLEVSRNSCMGSIKEYSVMVDLFCSASDIITALLTSYIALLLLNHAILV
jgi:hypothetical protein